MLMRTSFLTAADLGLREPYYDGCVEVLRRLESGELVWQPKNNPTVPNGFNMAHGWKETDCGTVGCITGWAYQIGYGMPYNQSIEGDMAKDATSDQRIAHDDLCCPTGWMKGRHTAEQAAHALRTYLLTGQSDWS